LREKKRIKKLKKFNVPITALLSCQSQQQTPFIIEASKCPQIRPLFTLFNCKSRGGYPAASFRTVPVTAIPSSFKAITDFQQTNKLLRNK
jgi:hypothetical protein